MTPGSLVGKQWPPRCAPSCAYSRQGRHVRFVTRLPIISDCRTRDRRPNSKRCKRKASIRLQAATSLRATRPRRPSLPDYQAALERFATSYRSFYQLASVTGSVGVRSRQSRTLPCPIILVALQHWRECADKNDAATPMDAGCTPGEGRVGHHAFQFLFAYCRPSRSAGSRDQRLVVAGAVAHRYAGTGFST